MAAKVRMPGAGAMIGFSGILLMYLGFFAPWLTISTGASVIPEKASGWGTIQALFRTMLQGPFGTGQDSLAWWLLLCMLALLLISLFPAVVALKARLRSTGEVARVYHVSGLAGLFVLLLLLCTYPALIPRFGLFVVVMPLLLIPFSPAIAAAATGAILLLIGGSIAARG